MRFIFDHASSMAVLLKVQRLLVHSDFAPPRLTVVVKTQDGQEVTYSKFLPTAFGTQTDSIGISGECAEVSSAEVSFDWRPDGLSGLQKVSLEAQPGDLESGGKIHPNSSLDRILREPVGDWEGIDPNNSLVCTIVH